MTEKLQKRFYNEKEIAQYTGISLSKLRNDRSKHQGLKYIKDGKKVLYDIADVNEYFASRIICPIDVRG